LVPQKKWNITMSELDILTYHQRRWPRCGVESAEDLLSPRPCSSLGASARAARATATTTSIWSQGGSFCWLPAGSKGAESDFCASACPTGEPKRRRDLTKGLIAAAPMRTATVEMFYVEIGRLPMESMLEIARRGLSTRSKDAVLRADV
jgi:hypothetical protein